MRMIFSNSCFDNNTFKQNTMEIRDEKEDSVKNVKTLPTMVIPPFNSTFTPHVKMNFFIPPFLVILKTLYPPMKREGAH